MKKIVFALAFLAALTAQGCTHVGPMPGGPSRQPQSPTVPLPPPGRGGGW